MGYLTEFRAEWRALATGIIGLSAGIGYIATTASIFAPQMLAEFGWSKAQFALTGTLVLVLVVAIPLAGRITDLIGVRRTALIGIISLPVSCVALSAMTGDIRQYLILYVIQAVLGATTTATVYCRIIVHHFRTARGLALAVGASGPAISGAILSPLLNEFVDAYGWRAGYQLLAVFVLVAGAIALLMIPRQSAEPAAANAPKPRRNKQVYAMIARMPVFWLLVVAVFLCNLPLILALSQMKLMLLDNGVTGTTISVIISAFSIGTLVGRFLCGIALDRYPMHIVSAVGLGLPSIGLFLIASPLDAPWLLTMAVFLFGAAYGAEGDVLSFVVARIFGLAIFSTVLGLLSAIMSIALASGAALLSLTLDFTGGFGLFLCISAGAALIGSLMFLLLGKQGLHPSMAEPQLVAAPASSASGVG